MTVRRVYPEDVAPANFLDRDPDPATAFAPVDGQPPDAPKPAEQPSADLGLATQHPALDPEPEPEPEPIVRPVVAYPDSVVLRVHLLDGQERLLKESVRYPLMYPVKYLLDGQERVVKEITAHPPALWDIQDWAAGRLKTNYELMARMLDMDPIEPGALRWPDIAALIDITTAMLPQELRDAIALSKQVSEPSRPGE
jgi:hypothetical protein